MSGKIAMKKKKCDLIKNHTQIYTFILITTQKTFFFTNYILLFLI